MRTGAIALSVLLLLAGSAWAGELQRLKYNNPGLTVDLGAGLWAWPLPMDYDGDGDLDLVVSSGGKPYEGTYFFENPSGGREKLPVFKPGRRVAEYRTNVQISPNGAVMTPGQVYPDFLRSGFERPATLLISTSDFHDPAGRIRANQWKRVDYDGDGLLDLIVGIGDWTDYGWDNAWNDLGEWRNGPLHGYVFWARNAGSDESPEWAKPQQVLAGGEPVDVFGMPSPSLGDFDGDGDLDLLCGEFLDGFTYFENVGSRRAAEYARGRRLMADGKPLVMDLQMITPTAIDWDSDGDLDLIAGDEDGRVALIEHTGRLEKGVPRFLPPVYFQQEADGVKFGALVTPVGVDWDGDGDQDVIAGNTAGYLGFLENLDSSDPPRFAAPVYFKADGETIRIQAGPNGSIQGPAEAKWGYTTLNAADWDSDGLLDLVVNSIWGKVVWYPNSGSRTAPELAAARAVEVDWDGPPQKPAWQWWRPKPHELATQWRTTPFIVDWNKDGHADLLMLDHEGYLALFERRGDGKLSPGKRLFVMETPAEFDSQHRLIEEAAPGLLRLNARSGGASGRRKISVADWDLDGRLDLLVNSVNVNWLRNVREADGKVFFEDKGPLINDELAGHTTSPTTVDWDGDGVPDLLIGAEDGFLYYMKNPRSLKIRPQCARAYRAAIQF